MSSDKLRAGAKPATKPSKLCLNYPLVAAETIGQMLRVNRSFERLVANGCRYGSNGSSHRPSGHNMMPAVQDRVEDSRQSKRLL
jgi:hypothetical protein